MTDYVWLTEQSRTFLENDYLCDGQTVDQRVDEICFAAEKYLKKPGFASRLKENFKKGWYSFSTPIWTNFGNDRGLPISCVVGDTWINTKADGGRQARDICLGDEVLTHKGRYKKITNIIVTKNRSDIWKLKIGSRMTNLYLTGDHRVLTNLGWVEAQNLNPAVHLVATNRVVECEEKMYSIDMRNYCDYPTVEKEGRLFRAGSKNVRKDRQVEIVSYFSSPFADVPVDEDLAWAFGLWFAEGSLTVNEKKIPNGIRITTNDKDEMPLTERWLSIMRDKFGVSGKGYHSSVIRHNQHNSWFTTNLNSKMIGNLFASFGIGCKIKTIPQWIMDLPKAILSNFLEGILAGDGHSRKNTVKITLANPRLILQLYQIGLKLGRNISLQMQQKGGKLSTTKYVYTLIFRDQQLGSGRFSGCTIPFSDGLDYAPIRTLERTEKTEDVYDFTVEEDHSFSAAGVILHNCFGSYIEDSMDSILHTVAEVGMMTQGGGGTSGYFGNIRPRGSGIRGGRNGKSDGPVHFMRMFDNEIQIISQGSTRRGNFAAYLPVDHADIMEFLSIRTEGHPIQDLSFGASVPDYWMEEMIAGDVTKRKIWARVLEARMNTGYPYIHFVDNANKGTVDVYKDKGLRITHSNLCNEINLPDGPDESFVCDLSSMNILHYDAWKDTDAVEVLAYLLDAVMTEFIEKASKIKFMERAVRFSERHRALGIGWLGWHSYLQSRMIPWESMEAKMVNVAVAKNIKEKAYAASAKMAQEYGEPELLRGYGRRNTTLMAIAPTKSSAFILGQVSEGIEPHRANYFVKDLAKGKFTYRNPYLEKLLEEKGQNTSATWESILKSGGSVANLSCLSDHEKGVFKTFQEISPKEIVIQAAQRQKYIDQGQSLNLMIHPSTPIKDVNALMIEAWKLGIKGFYYQISVNAAQNFSRSILTCSSCES